MVTERKSKLKKDIGIVAAVIIAAGLIVFCLIPVISSVSMSGKYKEFVSHYTDSMVISRKSGIITVVTSEDEYTINPDKASQIYNLIVKAGMGKPQKNIPEESPVELLFADGSVMQFWDRVITESAAQRENGLFVRYMTDDGYEYKYDTDALTMESILNKLKTIEK